MDIAARLLNAVLMMAIAALVIFALGFGSTDAFGNGSGTGQFEDAPLADRKPITPRSKVLSGEPPLDEMFIMACNESRECLQYPAPITYSHIKAEVEARGVEVWRWVHAPDINFNETLREGWLCLYTLPDGRNGSVTWIVYDPKLEGDPS